MKHTKIITTSPTAASAPCSRSGDRETSSGADSFGEVTATASTTGSDPTQTSETGPPPDATDSGDDTGGPGDTGNPDVDDPPLPPNEQIPPPDEEGCHGIFAQDLLPTFNLTIEPVVWELLQYEWNHGNDIEDMGGNPKGYHPLTAFEYGDVVITNAKIRLRGNPTYWDPIPEDKMQFQIGFHTNDENGNFWGIKRLVLESATYNQHLLRDRLSLAFMRDAGVAAPCANNARVVVNGEYYGIFTNVEKLDEVFLE